MKKILSIVIALAMCLSSIALLASCAGESAYEIAVRNGFEGTEQEWLNSLKGDKGDAGAAGAKGDKGDAGTAGAKGDTGAAGANGTNGTNGKTAYEIAVENGFTGTQAEWLASLKGNDGANGVTPEIGEDGNWWIGDINTGIPATGGNGGDASDTDATLINDTLAIINGVSTPLPTLKVLVAGTEVEIAEDLIIDAPETINAAGEYDVKVNLLGEQVTFKLKVTAYELVEDTFDATLEALAYQVKKIAPDATETTIDVTSEMIASTDVDTKLPGKYSLDLLFAEGLVEFEIVINAYMIYFEDFNDITATDKAGILAEIGWREGVIDEDDVFGTDFHYNRDQNQYGHIGDNGNGPKNFAPGMKNTGLYTTNATLAVNDGVLTIDNKTNNANGAYATFQIGADKYMAEAMKTMFTIQYDVVIKDAAPDAWVGFGHNSANGYMDDWTFFDGWFTRLHTDGLIDTFLGYLNAWYSVGYTEAGSKDYADMKTAGWICENIFGGDATDAKGQKVTIKVVYPYATGGVSHTGESYYKGYQYIYAKPEGATEFTCVAVVKDSNAYSYKTGVYDNDLVFAIGAKTEYNSYNSAKYPAASGYNSAPYAGQNSLNTETVTIDGVECPSVYLPEHDASAIIEIDNIAVWIGGGEMPTNTSTDFYASLVAGE